VNEINEIQTTIPIFPSLPSLLSFVHVALKVLAEKIYKHFRELF